jgi:hypothetical protein
VINAGLPIGGHDGPTASHRKPIDRNTLKQIGAGLNNRPAPGLRKAQYTQELLSLAILAPLDRIAKAHKIEQISERRGICQDDRSKTPAGNFKPIARLMFEQWVYNRRNNLTDAARTPLKAHRPARQAGRRHRTGDKRKFVENVTTSRTSQMQPQLNNSTKPVGIQDRLGYANLRTSGGEQEGKGSKARYLTQLYIMLRTARRNGWALVVCALRELIARYRGIA